jgi:hypothetical protein
VPVLKEKRGGREEKKGNCARAQGKKRGREEKWDNCARAQEKGARKGRKVMLLLSSLGDKKKDPND